MRKRRRQTLRERNRINQETAEIEELANMLDDLQRWTRDDLTAYLEARGCVVFASTTTERLRDAVREDWDSVPWEECTSKGWIDQEPKDD